TEKHYWNCCRLCIEALEAITAQWNEGLMFIFKLSIDTDNNMDRQLMKAFKKNIKQSKTTSNLYFLIIHLSERANFMYICIHTWDANNAFSKISEDMWRCAIIGGVKIDNIKMEHTKEKEKALISKEPQSNCIWKARKDIDKTLLAFGLIICNPRIFN
ncbi:hypothetical protein RFI_35669, partial [Reticulomyxa filosa]